MITLYLVGEGDRWCWRDMDCFRAALQLLPDIIRYEISSFKVLRAWLSVKVIKELRMPSKGEFGEIDRRLSLRDILAGEHMLRKLDRTFRLLVYRNLVIAPGLLGIDCHNPTPGLGRTRNEDSRRHQFTYLVIFVWSTFS